jgi:hypothetical protein
MLVTYGPDSWLRSPGDHRRQHLGLLPSGVPLTSWKRSPSGVRHYDASKTIEVFSARLRDQVDLDTLSAKVLMVVDQRWSRPRHRSGCGPRLGLHDRSLQLSLPSDMA